MVVVADFLFARTSLATTFMYLPLTRAEPPSPLRELSYQEESPLIGPQGDPEGWKVFPSVNVTGVLFDARQVELDCAVCMHKLLRMVVRSQRVFPSQLAVATPVSSRPQILHGNSWRS